MLSHDNLAWTANVAAQITDVGPDDTLLSYLPLSHIAEQMFTIHAAVSVGYTVYFAESIEQGARQPEGGAADALLRRAAHLGEVPRRDRGEARARPPARRRRWSTGQWASAAAPWHCAAGAAPDRRAGAAVPARQPARLLQAEAGARPRPGAHLCVTGAAPIAPEVLEFFAGLDLAGPRGLRPVRGQRADHVQPAGHDQHRQRRSAALPGVEVKHRRRRRDPRARPERVPRLLQGSRGDRRDADATAGSTRAISARSTPTAFCTSPAARRRSSSRPAARTSRRRTSRRRSNQSPLINEAVVIGDRRKYLTALLTLDPEAAAAFAASHRSNGVELHHSPRPARRHCAARRRPSTRSSRASKA